ncbi:ANKL1 protein, partial [Sula dactylatra]|nr:ANKL1 protein [Sula dactylatra]
AEKLTPLHVTASWGCCRCLKLLLKKGGDLELQDQDGKRAIDLALEQGNRTRVPILWNSQHAWGWPPVEDPGGPRCSFSFLTEDGSEAGPLSSTRRSLLEELGGDCGLGEPPLWPEGPPEPPSLALHSLDPWPHVDPGGPALPPQPLASSTMLSAGDELGEGHQSRTVGGRIGGPRWAVPDPSAGDSPGPSPQRDSAPGSSPTVLLCPGDHGHPQDSPSDAQGSPGSSPTVLLCPGDHGHAQDSPSDARGSPCSTALEPGSPAVPLLPASCSTHCSKEHPKDEEQGQALTEQHSPGTEATTSPEDAAVQDRRVCTVPPRPLSDEGLRRRLRALGDDPGPVTELTSPELAAVLRTGHVPDCTQDELALAQEFDRPDQSRRWREGLVKSSFNYLLLDPRTTQNLPLRSHHLSPAECFRTFIKAIFYVGKGTRARPYCHLAEALSQHRATTQKGCPKVQRILEIWASGQGVISVHCFQSTVPAEAYTREGCLVEALGLHTLTNQRKGNCYGVVASWPAERRRRLGVHMLHRAMRIFLAEGERQLRPADIQGGR